jgi:endonuclease YncB( thermonuclease family)
MTTTIYEAAALVLEVHDGDTVHLKVSRDFVFQVDPWFGMQANLDYGWTHDVKCRLARINAPELATPTGPPAKEALIGLLAMGTIRLVTAARDQYDRPLTELFVQPLNAPEFNVSDKMMELGFAKPWNGRGPKPV